MVTVPESWRGHDGDKPGILASASLSYKAYSRHITLELPGVPVQTWQLDLANDPDPITDYSPWRSPSSLSTSGIEMSYRLSAER